MVMRIRLELPYHLRVMADVGVEVELDVAAPVTIDRILDELEAAYPMLRGTIRDHQSRQRRPYLRYFACGQDLSHQPTDQRLPNQVADGDAPLIVVGAVAGG